MLQVKDVNSLIYFFLGCGGDSSRVCYHKIRYRTLINPTARKSVT